MRPNLRSSRLAIAVVLASVPLAPVLALDAPATAQDNAPPESGPEPAEAVSGEDTIVVLGARLIGQVDAPQPPVLELDAEDIAAYGAGSIAELLQALGPQVSSGRGRGGGGGPVILVNGVRISSFRELRSYPPEAIEKTEVFSEEVAQRYGYSADQRVVNFILKDNFSSREIEVEYGQPFEGGFSTQEIEATYLRIDGPSRLNFNLEWNNSSLLTEGERGVEQSNNDTPRRAGDPDPAFYRSLVADSASLEATANWTTRLGESGNSLSLNGTFEREDSLRLQGLDSVVLTDPSGTSVLRVFNADDPLTLDRRGDSYAAGATLNLGVGDWQVTGTSDATYTTSRSLTRVRADTETLVEEAAAGSLAIDAPLDGRVTGGGVEEALTDTYTLNALATARGNPIYLPAGDVSVTLDGGYRWNRIDSRDTRNPGVATDLDRSRVFAGANLSVPLTARDEFAGALGDITLNLSGGIDALSDFGTLYDWSAGITWGLTDSLTLNANYINRDEAPSLTQLGSPEIATPNVPTFDLANNQTVLATVITGGNPNLPAQSQSDWKIGLIWELPFLERSSFSVDYIRNHSENVAAGFPVLTPAIEAAFPDRVTRDGAGRLVSIDDRPVSFAEQDLERLQFGLNLSGEIAGKEEAAGGGRGGFGGARRNDGGGPAGGAVGGQRGPGGAGGAGGGFDPAVFARLRAQFCEAEPDALRELLDRAVAAAAAGEAPPPGPDGEPLTIPPQMLERLAGEDGRIDPARFAAMRERMCSAEGPRAGGPPQGAGRGGARAGRGGFRGPGGGGNGGRWFLNLQYTLDLDSTVLIAPGVPVLDLLEGDALSGGGQARHSASARAGVFYNGFGFITFANYTGASTILGSGLLGSTDLAFGDYVTVNLRAFADLGRQEKLVEKMPFLDNTRLGIGIDNLFDARQRVTDSSGAVPLRYQPFLIDPVGRSFEIELRKLF